MAKQVVLDMKDQSVVFMIYIYIWGGSNPKKTKKKQSRPYFDKIGLGFFWFFLVFFGFFWVTFKAFQGTFLFLPVFILLFRQQMLCYQHLLSLPQH